MNHGSSMTLELAEELAEALAKLLAPACERIEIAGSIRRKKAEPNDIELVAVPSYQVVPRILELWDNPPTTAERWTRKADHEEPLTDGVNLLDRLCDDLLRTGALEKRPDVRGRHCWGTGVKRMIFYRGGDYAPVDLFQVIEPVQWGVIHAIRTGPGDFNRLLVTSRWFGGGCPKNRKVAGGRVWDLGCNPDKQRVWAGTPAAKFAQLAQRGVIDVTQIPVSGEEEFFYQLQVPFWPPEERTVYRLREYLQQTTE